nr:hypothetical protein [Tanacetum cinerariifolium]
ERECKLYDKLEKFAYKKGETLRDFYLRFSLLLNDMNIYNVKLEQFQVNTKFLNNLPPEWSKFMTDVKLVQDLHTTNIDQLHAYLGQHEFHAKEVRLMHECNSDPLALVATHQMTQVTVQPVQGRIFFLLRVQVGPTLQQLVEAILGNEGLLFVTTAKGKDTCPNSAPNLKGKGMIPDLGLLEGQATQTVITHNDAYQADDLNAYDSDCNELNTTKVYLMANLSHYGLDALTESNVVNQSETEITNDSNIIPYSQYVIESQQAIVQNLKTFAQQDVLILFVIKQLKTQLINWTKINLDNKTVNDTLTVELERYKELVKVLKEGQNVMVKSRDNFLDSHEQNAEIDHLKQTLFEQLQEKESLMKTVTVLKNDFKKEESRNINREIALEKEIKHLPNIVYKRDQSAQTVHMLTKPKFFYDHTTKQALGLIIAALRDELKKLKGKSVVDTTVTTHIINPKILKVDAEPIAPRLLNNRIVHSDYLRLTQEQAAILKEVVEQGKSQNPLNNSLDHAFINDMNAHAKCKFVKKNSKRKVWKPTGKVFTNIGYIWRPTGQTFIIVGNACPLTRITTTTEFRTRTSCMTPTIISFGLVPNPPPSPPFLLPSRSNWDLLFQPLYDELLTLSPSVDHLAPKVIAPIAEVVAPKLATSIGSPSSTTVNQDAPTPNVAHMNNDPFVGIEESPKTPTFRDDPLHEYLHEDSTSQGSSSNIRQIHTPFESLGTWTKDHPIANVIGDPSHSVSTR